VDDVTETRVGVGDGWSRCAPREAHAAVAATSKQITSMFMRASFDSRAAGKKRLKPGERAVRAVRGTTHSMWPSSPDAQGGAMLRSTKDVRLALSPMMARFSPHQRVGRTDMGEIIDKVKGKAKQIEGDLTGNQARHTEGVIDELKGNVKGVVTKVEEVAHDAIDSVRQAVKKI
jgi:uncharacterized protein YjbJ (UPF0337 family)